MTAFFSSCATAHLLGRLLSLAAIIAAKLPPPPPINTSSETSTIPPPSLASFISLFTAFPSLRFSITLSLPVDRLSRSSSRPSRAAFLYSSLRAPRAAAYEFASASRAFWRFSTADPEPDGKDGPIVGPMTGLETVLELDPPPPRDGKSMDFRTEEASSSSRCVAFENDQE